MIDIVVLASIVVIIGTIAIIIDYYRLWCSKKCPYCGHRMTYVYDRYGNDGLEHGFRCNRCQAWVYIKEKEITKKKRKNDSK